MAARKKPARSRRNPKSRDPALGELMQLFTAGEKEKMTHEEKLRLLELLRDHRRAENWRATMDRLPDLLEKGVDEWGKYCDRQSRATWWSLLVHLGVLFIGAVTLLWLGLGGVLDGATIVALLGPLLTYVLVNLRHLTPGGRPPEPHA